MRERGTNVVDVETPPPLLQIGEVAKALCCSVKWVHGLVNAGRLPVVVLGTGDRPKGMKGPRMWRFKRSDVDAFIEASVRVLSSGAGEGTYESAARVPVTVSPAVVIPGWDGKLRAKRSRPRV